MYKQIPHDGIVPIAVFPIRLAVFLEEQIQSVQYVRAVFFSVSFGNFVAPYQRRNVNLRFVRKNPFNRFSEFRGKFFFINFVRTFDKRVRHPRVEKIHVMLVRRGNKRQTPRPLFRSAYRLRFPFGKPRERTFRPLRPAVFCKEIFADSPLPARKPFRRQIRSASPVRRKPNVQAVFFTFRDGGFKRAGSILSPDIPRKVPRGRADEAHLCRCGQIHRFPDVCPRRLILPFHAQKTVGLKFVLFIISFTLVSM